MMDFNLRSFASFSPRWSSFHSRFIYSYPHIESRSGEQYNAVVPKWEFGPNQNTNPKYRQLFKVKSESADKPATFRETLMFLPDRMDDDQIDQLVNIGHQVGIWNKDLIFQLIHENDYDFEKTKQAILDVCGWADSFLLLFFNFLFLVSIASLPSLPLPLFRSSYTYKREHWDWGAMSLFLSHLYFWFFPLFFLIFFLDSPRIYDAHPLTREVHSNRWGLMMMKRLDSMLWNQVFDP